jgi:hypothetical protein
LRNASSVVLPSFPFMADITIDLFLLEKMSTIFIFLYVLSEPPSQRVFKTLRNFGDSRATPRRPTSSIL